VLNSNCPGGCGAGSRQERWLRADLAASQARCTLAVIHHPRFSSDAIEGSQPRVAAFWEALYQAGADLVISGHARVYERMVPQNPAGKADPAYGLRLINVGTGGRGHGGFISKPLANSAVRDGTSFGVLKLTLHPQDYQWAFVPVAGARFTDRGSASCHGKPGGPGTQSLTFSAQADTHVIQAKPDSNYGAERSVLVDGEPVAESYLRFSVTGVNGTVTRARLRLWVTDGSADGPAVYPSALTVGTGTSPWAESAITWNRRPGRTGPVLDDRAATPAGQFADYDVTGVVAGNGSYSFNLAGAAKDGILFASRQVATATQRPRLVLEVRPGVG
jgi:hypothetical protein